MKKYLFKNAAPATHKTDIKLEVQKNAMVDDGEGTISFPGGLTITDDTNQWNGTRYDIESMDISQFRNKLTVNHSQDVEGVVGLVGGVQKVANKVVIQSIKFAINTSAMARYVYNMIMAEGGPFLTDFSIETTGPWPDEEGVYYNSKLIGLSVVAYANNKSAYINEIALNSMRQAKEAGLDTSLVEKNFVYSDQTAKAQEDDNEKESEMKYAIVKNSRGFAISVKFKNSQGEETEVTVNPGKTVEVPENEKGSVETQISEAQEPADTKEQDKDKKEETDVATAVANAIAPLQKQLNAIEQKNFDNSAQEPMFSKPASKAIAKHSNYVKELAGMDYRDLHALQINSIWDAQKLGSSEAKDRLLTINSYFHEKLLEAKKISNAITLADFGNFVISPELLTEIEGFRSNFQPLISRLNIRDTLSLSMAWLKRDGDINMQEVGFCEGDTPSNLKPISEYEADYNVTQLKEVAAVTPVCNAATRFAAVDLLADVAEGYRTDFDRKRAQLFIARLQQAVDTTGRKYPYTLTSDVAGLKSFFDVASFMQEDVMNGVYIMNQKTYWEIMRRSMGAGINTETGMSIFTRGENGMTLLGAPVIIVPNELLPSLNTNETKSFTVDGATITINQAVFYVDLTTYAGRTSGGLRYDMSTEAAYEVGGQVKSAFQRDELVMRGYFYRGGAVKNNDKVTGLYAAGVS